MARYELRSAEGRVLSKHRTKQGAIDEWRSHVGKYVYVWRTYSNGNDYLVVEGVWHRPIEPV